MIGLLQLHMGGATVLSVAMELAAAAGSILETPKRSVWIHSGEVRARFCCKQSYSLYQHFRGNTRSVNQPFVVKEPFRCFGDLLILLCMCALEKQNDFHLVLIQCSRGGMRSVSAS